MKNITRIYFWWGGFFQESPTWCVPVVSNWNNMNESHQECATYHPLRQALSFLTVTMWRTNTQFTFIPQYFWAIHALSGLVSFPRTLHHQTTDLLISRPHNLPPETLFFFSFFFKCLTKQQALSKEVQHMTRSVTASFLTFTQRQPSGLFLR